ncbi:MAG: hypothetical protein KatS3mg051_1151 [Anaerolineae bacterium]|nr:MAG: hypothetical protein KatS3mg051_1039 [Anaerolineae bacterium]GIV81797.1 MAG: hypothetical protein KatS3mg051_1151 [Anaerolineae bacterium]
MAEREWKAVAEVPAEEMRRRTVIRQDLYQFYLDVVRRLERTPAHLAIRYVFADEDSAAKRRRYVQQRARSELGKSTVLSAMRRDGQEWHVFFRRGPRWDRSNS